MAEIFTSGNSQVLMSQATAAHYGEWAHEFPVWAETQNVQTVLIITPEDILNGQNPSDLTHEERKELLETFIQENFPDFPIEQFEKELMSLGENAAFGKGRAEDVDMNNDGINDIGITIAPSRAQTKEQAAAKFAGLEEHEIKNISGTDVEWQILTVAHEIGHHDQPGKSAGMNLVWEVEAEQDMVNFMVAAHQKGLLSDLAVADEQTRLRSLKGFFFKSDLYTHVVAAAVQTPSEGSAPNAAEDLDLQEPMHTALMQVAFEIGKDLITDEDRVEALEEMYRKKGAYSLDTRMLPPMEIEDKKILIGIFKDGNDLHEGLEKIPEELKAKIEENLISETNIIGIGALRENPALMYETTRRLYLQGDFDTNPIGKQYAYEFLAAAQQFAPDHFAVADVNEQFTPPTFAETDQVTPHNHLDHSHTLIQP